ncbi:heavy-metal-associated domain-containing protein [Weissella paramesenteroides]|jgi:copper chaperone|uniref:Heavy-metal-associated domain-containing protein n=1 Tax=Weissella paramesenteroides TaxID=1249 RepID=A0A4Q7IY71_WEIPA|nr:heavy-metal-associated domain-containing protein [Weissella paramesenteroides]KAA8439941.1 heavy-metal-associated domain-containing protein [Weissella paramesenteroides]KAA8441302.1 heavy-metal-associated domain-containing protein [Weissella paramesenteroides]KAA8444044.1 heavy-metal-associated domain-containing protein [Weissella paramesenteroides]KAA8446056.1 heavy-metal-associated domain-containing protein [Weissella paramesenteroides]KAA8448750.1 heavy-metal-associated domain-containing
MNKIVLQLDELSCPSCLQKIQSALDKQVGITNVKVLFNAAKVKADFDSDKISADKVADTVTNLGYDVQSIKVK